MINTYHNSYLSDKNMHAFYSFEGLTWKVAPIIFVGGLFDIQEALSECKWSVWHLHFLPWCFHCDSFRALVNASSFCLCLPNIFQPNSGNLSIVWRFALLRTVQLIIKLCLSHLDHKLLRRQRGACNIIFVLQ